MLYFDRMKTIINLANVIKGNLSSSSMRLLHMSLYHNPPYIIENWLNIEAITCQKQRCSSFQANNIGTDKGKVVSSRGKTKVATKSIKERPLSEEQKRKRKEFFLKEEEWEKNLDLNRLSQREITIWEAHKKAVQDLHFTYDDPETGLKVITRLRHYLKGSCCGNACRHCVYNHEGVPEERKRERMFNSAFWKDMEE